MYGNAVKCDVCDHVDVLGSDSHGGFFDAGFAGWVRIIVNAPRDYGWSFREPKFATVVDSVDCCSIDCAHKYLNNVRLTAVSDRSAE